MSEVDQVRKQILALRKNISLEDRLSASLDLLENFKKFWAQNQHRKFKRISLFRSMGSEISIDPIIEYLENAESSLHFYFPKLQSDDTVQIMRVHPPLLSEQNWVKSSLGFQEPKCSNETASPDQIDLFLIPGVAFSVKGHRIGRGKGHYDRTLSKANPETIKIGVGYDFQVLEEIPQNDWDVPLNKILTGKIKIP